MSDAAQRFGELRSLLHEPPSKAAWSAICALIDSAAPDHARDILVPYALDLLRAWPDALRTLRDSSFYEQHSPPPASLPLVRTICDDNMGDWELEHLLAQPLSLTSLRLRGSISDKGAAQLASHPTTAALTSLDLSRNDLHDPGLSAVAQAAPQLGHLDLSWNTMRDAGAAAIAAAPLAALTSLNLEGSWASPNALLPLRHAPFCGKLHTLALCGRHVAGAVVGWIGWPTLSALDRAGFFAAVTHATIPTNGLGLDDLPLAQPLDAPLATHTLNIQDNRISGLTLRALAPVLLPPSLQTLNIGSNPLSGEGVRALVSRPLHALTTLHLTACNLDQHDLYALLSSQNLPQLTTLHLDHNQASPALALALAGQPHPFTLQRLSLGYNQLTDDAIIALAQQPALASLHTLTLQECELTAEACRALSSSPYLRSLRHLSLNHNLIRDAGARWLADGEWPALQSLELWRCGISTAGAAALARAPWTARLSHLDLTDNPIYQEGRDALASSPHLPDALRRTFLGPPPHRRRPLPGEDAP